MNTITIAFDVDGTLIQNGAAYAEDARANPRIRDLLITMAHMKNVKIMVWSGGGEQWARDVVSVLGLQKYVDKYADKMHWPEWCSRCLGDTTKPHAFHSEIKPDIAIDDIQDCELGDLNLIVREK